MRKNPVVKVPMVKVKDIVRELSDLPLRRNTLKSQRRALGLSRAALARILEVDPSTVYRQELQNPMSMLWSYALRGLAAEAASKTAKRQIREHKAEIARRDQLLGAARRDAEGSKLVAERMREAEREQSKPKSPQPVKRASSGMYRSTRQRARALTPEQVKDAADRAEARSKA
jgi:hypothetical protein